MDDFCSTFNPVGIRICEQLHDGRFHPYSVGNCRCHGSGQCHSRPESHVTFCHLKPEKRSYATMWLLMAFFRAHLFDGLQLIK